LFGDDLIGVYVGTEEGDDFAGMDAEWFHKYLNFDCFTLIHKPDLSFRRGA
jgi:hypothetical protein